MTEPTSPAKAAGEKDDGITKYMRRMKTVLRGTRSNRASVSSLGEILGESSKSKTPAKPASTSAKPAASTQNKTTAIATATTTTEPQVHNWRAMQQERARALFAKYGLTLEPGEWITQAPADRSVQRVEKPIRMRVRRVCHNCTATFGADKVCSSCQHVRCKKCFRYPPAKPKDDGKGKTRADIPAPKEAPKKVVLTLPSRTGGQDLVCKPIRQRIRRTCHKCSTVFIGDATECENCSHIRCKNCPRDPAKPNKYPDGYPGDVEPPFERQQRVWRKPRRRIRWTCHECKGLFVTGDKTCARCNHDRCKDCIRDPPKKTKPDPDPELLRRVEERLAQLNVS
ncbi:hypothetical protein AJ80_01297 [Polytolypa hystricis UAMH7299]|uniref:Uncharacterized protein n=1 Tax=Polytolypa hystricis (strain UAMH7299) TaxID=1447883 RepID=A0A2B7YZ13_POLH7|nr:hypothetical protein AJ80_01297 [Polytolypa hystricis UAMH7299]